MRADLPDWAKRWLGMGGKVYYVYYTEVASTPSGSSVAGYVRAFNRAGALRIAREYDKALRVGKLLTQAEVAGLAREPWLKEIGAAAVYRGNPAGGFDGSRRTATTAYVVHLVDPATRRATCGSTTGAGARDVASVNCGRCLSASVKKNPPLVVLGNPGKSKGSKILSRNIMAIRYQHEADGEYYEHKFKRGSVIELLPDGSIRVFNPRGVKLWGDY